jgi:hypothetical protein
MDWTEDARNATPNTDTAGAISLYSHVVCVTATGFQPGKSPHRLIGFGSCTVPPSSKATNEVLSSSIHKGKRDTRYPVAIKLRFLLIDSSWALRHEGAFRLVFGLAFRTSMSEDDWHYVLYGGALALCAGLIAADWLGWI